MVHVLVSDQEGYLHPTRALGEEAPKFVRNGPRYSMARFLSCEVCEATSENPGLPIREVTYVHMPQGKRSLCHGVWGCLTRSKVAMHQSRKHVYWAKVSDQAT